MTSQQNFKKNRGFLFCFRVVKYIVSILKGNSENWPPDILLLGPDS